MNSKICDSKINKGMDRFQENGLVFSCPQEIQICVSGCHKNIENADEIEIGSPRGFRNIYDDAPTRYATQKIYIYVISIHGLFMEYV
jgi:hypothetical protein